jgi:pSer/pThr/pTyr-binding forkhead associated (FHA) protein
MTVRNLRRIRIARLLVLRDNAVLRAVQLRDRGLTLGRGQQNDVVLDDPERTISRFHAEVHPEGTQYVLVDLDSQNGTWVDDSRVNRVELRPDVPVRIGPYVLVFDDTPIETED